MASAKTEPRQSKVVSHEEWVAARKEFLKKEKEFTHQRDELSRLRRELPRERVEKEYVFEGPYGKVTLAGLFGGRSQLFIYHFMLGPGWKEGCPSCSYISDHFDGMKIHLANRDIMLAAVSHAPIAEIEAFKKRMGWQFKWVSANASDFNFDYQVSVTPDEVGKKQVYYNYELTEFPAEERPGASAFYKDANGAIFHTYSTYARGLDILLGAYNVMDLMPKGRDEEGLTHTMSWVRHHDKYTDGYVVDANAPYKQPEKVQGGACCHEEKH